MKDLYKLKQSEYSHGASLCLSNTVDHFNAGVQLGESNLYGFACTHFVLALEELAKASVLQVKAIDNKMKIEDFSAYFHKHSIKHHSISSLFAHSIKYADSYDVSEISLSDRILLVLIAIICLIKKDTPYEASGPGLEEIRLLGCYVNLNDDRSWNTPSGYFSRDHFEESKIQVSAVIDTIRETLFSGKIHKQNIEEFVVNFNRRHQ